MLKMRAALEIALVYAMNGASITASAAADAFFVINSSEIVHHADSVGRADLFALTAGNTAVFTELSYLCALFPAVTLNNNTGGIVYKMYDSVRTGSGADAAADALSRVYFRNATLRNTDSVSRTNLGAIAIAKAGKGAKSVAKIAHICSLAGFRSCVLVFLFLGGASAVAGNVGYTLDNRARFHTEYFGNLLGNAVTARGTKIGFIGSSVTKSLCISVTARKSASAAVSTGKNVTNNRKSFIL